MPEPIDIPRFRVPAALIAEFAQASQDTSPLHVDPGYARKTPFGQPVTHGVLAVLIALSLGPNRAASCLHRLRATFLHPVLPDRDYVVFAEDQTDSRTSMRLMDGTRTILEITAEYTVGDLAAAPAGGVPSAAIDADTPSIDHMAESGTIGQEYQPDWAALDQLTSHLRLREKGIDVHHVAALCWASYLAGMRVPGRAALISAVEVDYASEENGTGFTAAGEVADVDRRYRRVRLAGRLSTGSRSAQLTVMTFVRREHQPPDTAAIRRLLTDRPAALAGKIALVTGGSRGLGAALVQALAIAGCEVYAAFARSSDEARHVAAQLGADADRVHLVQGDVADRSWCDRLARTITQKHGGLDLLVLNAGPPVHEYPDEPAFTQRSAAHTADAITISQTPLSAFIATLAARDGWVVAVSSAYVHQARRGLSHYITAKHALEAMVHTAAADHPAIRTLVARPPRLATTFADSALGAEEPLYPEVVAAAIVGRIGADQPGVIDDFPAPMITDPPAIRTGTIGVAATFTIDPLVPLLRRWLDELHLDLTIEAAPYGQVFPQLLDPGSVFSATSHGVNVALVRLGDWPDDDQPLEDLVRAARTYAERAAAPLVVVVCPSAGDDATRTYREDRLCTDLQSITGVSVVRSADWNNGYPVSAPFDPARELLAHIPYTADGFHALAATIMRRVHATLVPPFKALVLDCDNTLWHGVCGEVGPEGITVTDGHRALQQWAVRLHGEGVLICLASKNAQEDVDEVFLRRPDMPLKAEHIAARRVTWDPKSRALGELAAELNIGVDSMVLIDDNPVETAEVAAAHPAALTLTLPGDDRDIPAFLQRIWAFDKTTVTDTDRSRNDSYRAERARRDLARSALTFRDFLAGLNLRVEVHEVRPDELDRVTQLTQRTNQFNLSGVRRTEPELRRWLGDGHRCWVAYAADRFGDYGLVGVAMCDVGADRVDIDTFLLSCRAMGKGVEHTLLARMAQQWPVDAQVRAVLVPSSRNIPARRFFDEVFGAGATEANNRIVYQSPARHAAAALFDSGNAVAVTTPAPPTAAPEMRTDPGRRAALTRIATQWTDIATVRRHLDDDPPPVAETTSTHAVPANAANEALAALFRAVHAAAGGTAPTLRADTTLESLALTSLQIVDATVALEQTYGRLPRTLFFEYRTLGEIAAQLPEAPNPVPAVPPSTPDRAASSKNRAAPVTEAPAPLDDIAVVGMAGRFPRSADVRELWQHLLHGHDLVDEVSIRWTGHDVVDPQGGPAKTYTAAGGVLDGIDEFDPLFFGISPAEAETMDPQQRLLLQTAYHALEDAGHPCDLGRNVGVYVGAMSSDFALANAAAALSGASRYPNADLYQLANRISHFLDLTGPSIVVDTACSASGTALQLAFDALRAGRVRAAIVGAVNLILHPSRRIQYAQMGMLSHRGRCQPFSANADGMVTSEGVTALALRPLRDAVADGDHVYGVIRAIGMNTDGRTNGFMVPSPAAQADLISETWRAAGLDPRTLGYIEAHGTGTPLGDPIEIRGLAEGLRLADMTGHVPIGSIKSNVGHLEAAAALAGVTKVLLQLDHRTLVPSLHADELNPHIDFAATPFTVQRSREPWPAPHGARRAAVSSFGAGGVNVHLVIEEAPPVTVTAEPDGPELVLLSARAQEQLRHLCLRLARHLRTDGTHQRLADIAYTLRAGRQPLEHRAAMVARDRDHLLQILDALAAGDRPAEVITGQAGRHSSLAAVFDGSPELAEALGKLAHADRWETLGRLWVEGATLDWPALAPRRHRRLVPLPGYPFAAVRLPHPQTSLTAPTNQNAAEAQTVVHYRSSWEPQAPPAATPDADVVVLADQSGPRQDSVTTLTDVTEIGPRLTGRPALIVADYRALAGSHHDEPGLLLRTAMDLARLARRERQVTYVLATADDTRSPAGSTVVGFARALAHENPFFRAVRVIAGSGDTPALATLLAEATATGDEVRWTGAERLVRRWRPVAPTPPTTTTWHDGGTYVLTGGSGGMARVITGQLLRQHHARVVLIGRSTEPAHLPALTDLANRHGGQVLYLRADVTDREQLGSSLTTARQRFGRLHGVLHAAGLTADRAFTDLDEATVRLVTAPKITGTILLDQLTAEDDLDFFVLMSSVVSLFGNAGQSSYAAANAYLDAFATWRSEQVRAGARRGISLSILWPSWQNGGMVMPSATRRLFTTTVGLTPIGDAAAWQELQRAIGSGDGTVLLGHGDKKRIEQALIRSNAPTPPARHPIHADLAAAVKNQLRTEAARLIKSDVAAIDDAADFGDYGFNSLLFTDFANRLNEHLGLALTPVVFFTHPTIDALTAGLVQQHRPALTAALTATPTSPADEIPPPSPSPSASATPPLPVIDGPPEPVAVVGMAGRFPAAADLDEYWQLLMSGECVTGAPPPGRETSPGWPGGYLEEITGFDAGFFGISPREARLMDPQQRLFLEAAWQAVEHAGYDPRRLAGSATGVFSAATLHDYSELLQRSGEEIAGHTITGHVHSIIANRVSYLLDLAGPSESVDTACSSSLTALHRAVSAIRQGECSSAIVGGVNVLLTAGWFASLQQTGVLSPTARCWAFDARADGFVRSEGVAAVYLKPLSRAIEDGDTIHGLIRGTAVNHGGRGHSLTAPRPDAQAAAVTAALRQAHVPPRSITYIETHGTGTKLGDPVELAGLRQAFDDLGAPAGQPWCHLGAVKGTIGHLESAAGMAGLIKVLLAFRHGVLPPNASGHRPNPHLNLDDGPFRLLNEATPWRSQQPGDDQAHRYAGISAFGFGGANAHTVLQEPPSPPAAQPDSGRHHIVVLSARSDSRLRRYAERLRDLLTSSDAPIADLAHTSRAGRTPLPSRLALVAQSRQQLAELLDTYLAGHRHPAVHLGTADAVPQPEADDATHRLAQQWVQGDEVTWPAETSRRRVPFPTYPFDHSTAHGVLEAAGPASASATPEEQHPDSTDSTDRTDTAPRLLVKEWTPAPLTPAAVSPAPRRCGLILSADACLPALDALAAYPGTTWLVIRPGITSPRLSSFDYEADFADYDSGRQTAERVIAEHGPITHVIDLADATTRVDTAGEAARVGALQALVRHATSASLRLVHVTRGLTAHGDVEPAVAGSRFAALVRAVGAEYQATKTTTVDADLPPEDVAGFLAIALAELDAPVTPEVIHHDGVRHIPTLTPQSAHPAIGESHLGVVPVDPHRAYLITGGTGGLGLATAERLATLGARHLALTGLRPPPDRADWDNLPPDDPWRTRVAVIRRLEDAGVTVTLHHGPLTDATVLRQLIDGLPPLAGVVHAAGAISRTPAFVHKTFEEIERCWAPKGAALDVLLNAVRQQDLDFFVCYSSLSAVLPELAAGLSDYASGNAYMDAAMAREQARADHAGRSTRYLSINWGSWSGLGMGEVTSPRYRSRGFAALTRAQGLSLLEQAMATSGRTSVIAVASTEPAPPHPAAPPHDTGDDVMAATQKTDDTDLHARCVTHLRAMLARHLLLDGDQVGPDTAFADLGVDSILIAAMVPDLEAFADASLDPSLVLEHPTLNRLTTHLLKHHRPGIARWAAGPTPPAASAADARVSTAGNTGTALAIIGMSGRYPGAEDLDAFWDLLSAARTGVTEVPRSRWDVASLYSPQRRDGMSVSKWGGFLTGIEDFDPDYFGIPAHHADHMDPLVRLLLESAEHTFADAGYRRSDLAGRRVGVFAGSGTSSYGQRISVPHRATATGLNQNFIAAQLAQTYDLRGPNLVVDTACSSSLSAIYLARQALLAGECEMALVAGADLILDETPYLSLSAAQALSPDGACHVFDAAANGLVPGEGVGAVLIRRLDDAITAGDRILAVIEAAAMNNDGRTMGLTTPNPDAQRDVVSDALAKAGVSADTLSYIEAHGTGTMIGDPIELRALTQVFEGFTTERGFCAIGSVKSNVGHLLMAAGMASLQKVVLALHHRALPATLHCERPNPRFAFDSSPFYPNVKLRDWTARHGVRRAGVSAFGFGGTNCHVIIREPLGDETDRGRATRNPLPPPVFHRRRFWIEKRRPAPPAARIPMLELEDMH